MRVCEGENGGENESESGDEDEGEEGCDGDGKEESGGELGEMGAEGKMDGRGSEGNGWVTWTMCHAIVAPVCAT